MNTKEDGRCHPPFDPFDVQCNAKPFMCPCVRSFIVLGTRQSVMCARRKKKIEKKEEHESLRLFIGTVLHVYMIVVRRRERNETLWPNIVPSDHSRFTRSFVTFSVAFQDWSAEFEKMFDPSMQPILFTLNFSFDCRTKRIRLLFHQRFSSSRHLLEKCQNITKIIIIGTVSLSDNIHVITHVFWLIETDVHWSENISGGWRMSDTNKFINRIHRPLNE